MCHGEIIHNFYCSSFSQIAPSHHSVWFSERRGAGRCYNELDTRESRMSKNDQSIRWRNGPGITNTASPDCTIHAESNQTDGQTGATAPLWNERSRPHAIMPRISSRKWSPEYLCTSLWPRRAGDLVSTHHFACEMSTRLGYSPPQRSQGPV